MGIDRKAGRFRRKPTAAVRERKVIADQIHKVGGILAIMDGECGVEANCIGMVAQQTGCDGVEGSGPGHAVGHQAGAAAQKLWRDERDLPGHLGCGAAGEGQQHDAVWIDAGGDEVTDAVGERIGLAGSGAGDDEQRRRGARCAEAICNGLALLGVELGENGDCGWVG